MKKILCGICLFFLLMTLYGCETASQLDLTQGYGDGLKLIHLSAGSGEDLQRIYDFQAALQDSYPLDKPASLFSYYPDYKLEIRFPGGQGDVSAVIDINDRFVDFYYAGREDTLYRANMSVEDFLALVHRE